MAPSVGASHRRMILQAITCHSFLLVCYCYSYLLSFTMNDSELWSRKRDSNPRWISPPDYRSGALTNYAISANNFFLFLPQNDSYVSCEIKKGLPRFVEYRGKPFVYFCVQTFSRLEQYSCRPLGLGHGTDNDCCNGERSLH